MTNWSLIRLITTLIFCLIAIMLSGQSSYSIKVTDRPLSEILSHIEQSYGINFAYDSDLNVSELYSFDLESAYLEDILEPILSKAGLESMAITDHNILIRRKNNAQVQPTHQLTLVDSETGEGLEMVAVSIVGTKVGNYTDSEGRVSFFLDEHKTYQAKISLVGYEDQIIEINAESSKSTWQMDKSIIDIEEVIVKDRQNIIATDPIQQEQNIRVNESTLQTSGVAGKDIMRQVQLVSGISAHNDKSAGLQIRGASEDKTLIVLDGIPIYNPSHYYGVFSSINASYVDNTSLYKNNLPIQYGGKTSGMLNLSSENLSDLSEVKGIIDVNLLTSSLVLQVPISQALSFQLNGRTTYDNVSESGLAQLFSNAEEIMETVQNFSLVSRDSILSALPDYKFSDWNAKINLDINDDNNVNLNFYNSDDAMSNSYANQFEARARDRRIEVKESYKNTEDWTNLGGSMNWTSLLSQDIKLNSTLYYTQFGNNALVDVSIFREQGTEVIDINRSNQIGNNITDFGFKSFMTYQLEKNNTLVVGIDIENKENELSIAGENLQSFDQNQSAEIYSAFGSYQVLFDNGWAIGAGLRGSYFSVNDQFYFSPRINLVKSIEDSWTLKASAARQNQFVKELSYENPQGRSQSLWVIAGSDKLPVNTSDNFMLGATYTQDRWSIDIEGFYRTANGINEYAFINNQFDENQDEPKFNNYQLYAGQSTNYGVDFMLSFTQKDYASWLAYTWSKGTNSFDEISRGEAFPSQEDRRHQFKWINQYSFKQFNFNANIIYSSGRPYTDLTKFTAISDRNNIRPKDRISRLPAYFRLDMGVDYSFKISSQEARIGLSVFNLTDRNNVNYLQYIFSVPSNRQGQEKTINTIIGTETNLLPQTINLNFSYTF